MARGRGWQRDPLRARVELATADSGDLLGAGRWRLVRSRLASRRQVDLGGRRTGRRARRAASGRVGANERGRIRMALKITKASDPLTVEQLIVCIYGPPGLGKTTLGFSARKPLLLDFDRGAHRAAENPRVGLPRPGE